MPGPFTERGERWGGRAATSPAQTRHPAVRVELGFIDTGDGRAFLTNPANQENLARLETLHPEID